MRNAILSTTDSNNWYMIGTNKIHTTSIIDDSVILGENNIIYPYTVIGNIGFIRDCDNINSQIVIGNNNIIGNFVSIMRGESSDTVIGDNNLIMNYVNIGHDSKIGNDNEIGVRTIIAGYVKIGNNNKIKINCNFRNRVTLGSDNIIGMGSNVTKSFNSNMIIYGTPAKKIKLNSNYYK